MHGLREQGVQHMGDETNPIWPSDEPTNPRGARPSGPPPSGPPSGPPALPPTAMPPQQQSPQWSPTPPPLAPHLQGPPNQGPSHQGPPYGPPPGFGGPGYGAPPPRRRRVGLVIAALLSLALVAGLAVAGFLYATGRFGIGPLSAADKDAADAIVDGVEKPAWADDDQVECAVDELVHEYRSEGLQDRGLVEYDGGSWAYNGQWRGDDAVAFNESLLDCDDDWAKAVGKEWGITDTECLDGVDTAALGAFFAQESFTLTDGEESVEEDSAEAVAELDECYLEEPDIPRGVARAAYRSLEVVFTEPVKTSPGETVISTGGEGSWTPLSGDTVTVDTEEGGVRRCVEAQAVTTLPWGSTAEKVTEICGTSQPKRIFWKRPAKKCTQQPGCYSFQLHYEGFKDYASITARYTSDGGGCMATSGRCSDTVTVVPGGKGTIVTWSFPRSYRGDFRASVGKLFDEVPN